MKKFMKRTGATLTLICLLAITVLLAGCGGGGGGEGVSSQVVSGVAAVGAPLAGQVKLKDFSIVAREKITVIGSDGAFAIDVTDMKGPFVLQAKGSANGENYTLHSFAGAPGIANINPLSNVALANAAGVDDPATIYANPDPARIRKIESYLQGTIADLQSKLHPLLRNYSAENENPLRDEYRADHTRLDGMFDNVKITLTDGILTITNAETGAIIFSGKVTDIKGGHFTDVEDDLPTPGAIPAAPGNVAAEGGDGQVKISWGSVANARSYNIYWSTTAGVTSGNGTKISGATTPYIHTGLFVGTQYYYIVTALNRAGESVASSEVSMTTNVTSPPSAAAPAAPTGVSATGGTNQVTLAWSAASGATSYNMYWSTTSGVTTATGTKISGVTSPAVHASLPDNTTYYYIVTAVNSAGEGSPSVQVAATTMSTAPPADVPSAPTGITATGGTNQVTLSWSAVSGAAAYNVYWSPTSGVTTATGTKIAGVTSPYVHSGRAAGTAYYYVVTAVNSVGESLPSAGTAATTTAAVIDGAALYAGNCADCHGSLATSGKRGRTAAQIQTAIAANRGGMSFLSTLTAAQIQAIAAALQ